MNLLGTGAQRSAKAAQVSIGQSILAFATWNVNQEVADLDTVNFTCYDVTLDKSFGEGISGVEECRLEFGGDWDASANPYDDPPGCYPRDDLTDLAFSTNVVDALAWAFPYARLRSTTNGAQVRDKVTFTCSGMSQGPYTPPTGSV